MVAASLEGLTRQYEMLTHNLANASTAGYKRQSASFAQALEAAGAVLGGGSPPVAGETVTVDFSQGALRQTGSPLDLALDGKGFFVIETPEGELYTRNGSFRINSDRRLVDSDGRLVAGDGGPITLPEDVGMDKIAVAKDGSITAGSQNIGRLRIVDFPATSALLPVGGGCFRPLEGPAAQTAQGASVQQGFQESSNVSVVEEVVNLITVARMYEANLKSVQTQDEGYKALLQVAMGS